MSGTVLVMGDVMKNHVDGVSALEDLLDHQRKGHKRLLQTNSIVIKIYFCIL